MTKSPWIIIACDDQDGCSLLRERNFDRTLFLPHAVGMDIETENKKRIYDVVFLGTCIDPEMHRKQWKKMFSSEICKYMEEAARISLEDMGPSFMSILSTHLDPEINQQAFEEVELYIKGVDRLQLVEAFTESHLHVFGSSTDKHNWKNILKKHQNIKVHPPISYEQAIDVMKQSKFVLNSSIKNKHGAHERIFTAAACGAVVITNAVPFIEEHFKNKKELLLYNQKGLSKLESEVQILLKDENKRLAIAEAGRERVMKIHTWDHRVEHLLREVLPMLKKMKKRR